MQLFGREIGNRSPLFLIAGPCVVEAESLMLGVAEQLRRVAERHGLLLVYKASFDKANRTSASSYRGPGLSEGLRILEKVKREVGVPVLTDVHEDTPVDEVASVVDVLQTPAFLVRQTNFIQRVARSQKPMNIKKGQFQAPWDMQNVVDKCRSAGNDQVSLIRMWLTSRNAGRRVVGMPRNSGARSSHKVIGARGLKSRTGFTSAVNVPLALHRSSTLNSSSKQTVNYAPWVKWLINQPYLPPVAWFGCF